MTTDDGRMEERRWCTNKHTNTQTEEVKQICKSSTYLRRQNRPSRSFRDFQRLLNDISQTILHVWGERFGDIVGNDDPERLGDRLDRLRGEVREVFLLSSRWHSLFLLVSFAFCVVRVKKKKWRRTKQKPRRKKRSVLCVQTERVKYVPSRAGREIFITQQQQQLLLLFAYTMYTRAYKCVCVCVCVSVREKEVDGVNLRSWVVREREAMW
jgi:hypothetical protein